MWIAGIVLAAAAHFVQREAGTQAVWPRLAPSASAFQVEPPRNGVGRRAALASALLLSAPAWADAPPSLPQFPSMLPENSRGLSMFLGASRPKPKQLPRLRLEQDFAVLLMRTSYGVADELDFMPMDAFQRNMFLFRQREWEGYREELRVQQGDLADPAYFDFMSYVQYATIADGMRNGQKVFNELVDAGGASVVVARDPTKSPMENELLPAAHAKEVGERILAWIDEKSPGLRPQVPARATRASVLAGVEKLASVFLLQNYMLQSDVKAMEDGRGIEWTLVAPATLWSAQMLRQRGDFANDFEAKAALAYLRRCGVVGASVQTRLEPTSVVHTFRWPPGVLTT